MMADASAAATMHEYVVWWVSGNYAGTRRIRATDSETVRRDLEANPSTYGLPHERATVLQVRRSVVIDAREYEHAVRHR